MLAVLSGAVGISGTILIGWLASRPALLLVWVVAIAVLIYLQRDSRQPERESKE